MFGWIRELDRILRGEATGLQALRRETVDVPAAGLCVVIVGLGMISGACMGCYALCNREMEPALWQLLASTLKVPALFFLTLIVTFPSLYVFNALVGSRLTVPTVLRLLIAALGVNLAVLASLGPIVAFFSWNTTSYPFIVLLNVLVFAISGGLGLVFLLQTLHRLSIARLQTSHVHDDRPDPADVPPDADMTDAEAADALEPLDELGPLDYAGDHMLGRHVKTVFRCWMVVFGLVGAQMGWVLRPFIGDPYKPFQWFRPRESNFLEAVWRAFLDLFG